MKIAFGKIVVGNPFFLRRQLPPLSEKGCQEFVRILGAQNRMPLKGIVCRPPEPGPGNNPDVSKVFRHGSGPFRFVEVVFRAHPADLFSHGGVVRDPVRYGFGRDNRQVFDETASLPDGGDPRQVKRVPPLDPVIPVPVRLLSVPQPVQRENVQEQPPFQAGADMLGQRGRGILEL